MRVTAALAMLGLATAAGIVAPLTTVGAMRLRGGNVQFGHAAAKGGRKNAFQIAVCHDVHACACAPLVCDGRLLSGAGLEFPSLCVGASTAAAVLASLPARNSEQSEVSAHGILQIREQTPRHILHKLPHMRSCFARMFQLAMWRGPGTSLALTMRFFPCSQRETESWECWPGMCTEIHLHSPAPVPSTTKTQTRI